MIDDIISSGISIIKAAEVLHKKGVGKIFAMCTHALLIRDAARKSSLLAFRTLSPQIRCQASIPRLSESRNCIGAQVSLLA